MRRYALRDDQWERIRDLLPGREGDVGVTAQDNRLFVEAVLYRYRAGIPWRDLPERFGDWKNVHRRFSRSMISLEPTISCPRCRPTC
jgi:transposase